MLLLLALSLACAPKPTPVSEPVVDEPDVVEVSESESALTEPPFSAEEIRGAMPAGLVIRLRLSTPKGVLASTWEVLEADAEGCTVRYSTFAEGGALIEASEARSLWTELESHAHFPAAQTTLSEGEIETAMGQHAVITAVVEEGGLTRTFHFAEALPGAPILMTVTQDGQELTRMEMLSRALP